MLQYRRRCCIDREDVYGQTWGWNIAGGSLAVTCRRRFLPCRGDVAPWWTSQGEAPGLVGGGTTVAGGNCNMRHHRRQQLGRVGERHCQGTYITQGEFRNVDKSVLLMIITYQIGHLVQCWTRNTWEWPEPYKTDKGHKFDCVILSLRLCFQKVSYVTCHIERGNNLEGGCGRHCRRVKLWDKIVGDLVGGNSNVRCHKRQWQGMKSWELLQEEMSTWDNTGGNSVGQKNGRHCWGKWQLETLQGGNGMGQNCGKHCKGKLQHETLQGATAWGKKVADVEEKWWCETS